MVSPISQVLERERVSEWATGAACVKCGARVEKVPRRAHAERASGQDTSSESHKNFQGHTSQGSEEEEEVFDQQQQQQRVSCEQSKHKHTSSSL